MDMDLSLFCLSIQTPTNDDAPAPPAVPSPPPAVERKEVRSKSSLVIRHSAKEQPKTRCVTAIPLVGSVGKASMSATSGVYQLGAFETVLSQIENWGFIFYKIMNLFNLLHLILISVR